MYELGEKEEWIELYKYKNNFLKERGLKRLILLLFIGIYFLKVVYRKKENI